MVRYYELSGVVVLLFAVVTVIVLSGWFTLLYTKVFRKPVQRSRKPTGTTPDKKGE